MSVRGEQRTKHGGQEHSAREEEVPLRAEGLVGEEVLLDHLLVVLVSCSVVGRKVGTASPLCIRITLKAA